jgi:hypothetical protein
MLMDAAGAIEGWFSQEEDHEKAGYDNYGDYWWSIKPDRNQFDPEVDEYDDESYEAAHKDWMSKKPKSGSWLGGY